MSLDPTRREEFLERAESSELRRGPAEPVVAVPRPTLAELSSARQAEAAEHALREQLEAVDAAALVVTQAFARPDVTTARVLEVIGAQAAKLTEARSGSVELLPARPRAAQGPALSVVVRFGDRALGTLTVTGRRVETPFQPRDRASLEMLAERVGHAIELARSQDEQRRDRERLLLLSDAGRTLGSSLEPKETAARLARLLVPRLADWVVFHQWTGERLEFDCLAHDDEACEQHLGEQLAARCLYPGAHGLLARVARSHHSVLLARATRAAEVFGVEGVGVGVEDFSVHACLCVPLLVGPRFLGTLLFGRGREHPAYDVTDLALAEELAARTGLALEHARLYQEAREAVRSRDNVMAIVSHDLRNPLNAIALNLSLLTRPWGDGATDGDRRKGRSQLESIQRAVQRVGRMVDDLLAASTIQAGHFAVRAAAEDAQVLVGDLVQALEPLAAHQDVRLETDFPASLPPIRCDRDRVLQVFANLCGNALHVTPAGGRIRVGARHEGPQVHFCVEDTGPGIPPAQLAAVFDRYWQAEPGSGSGVGLGLFIVKGIVEAHGGRVWAESPPGQGACFHFTLPTAA